MDFTTILNRKNSAAAAAAAAEAQLHQQYLQNAQMNQPTMKAEPGASDNPVNAYPPHPPPGVPMDQGLAESFYYGQPPGRLLGTWAMSLVDMPVNRRCSNHRCLLEGPVATRPRRLSTAGPVTRDLLGAVISLDMVRVHYLAVQRTVPFDRFSC